MKLNEIAYKHGFAPKYGPAKDGVNWDLPENPHYKVYPELQDDILAGLSYIEPEEQKVLLAKYGVTNQAELHALAIPKMFELVAEIKTLLNIQD